MNPLSLKELMHVLENKSLLFIKEKLLCFKKEGILFFKDPIHNQEEDKPIELYYAKIAGNIRYRNAFPVPASHWWRISQSENPCQLLGAYYKSYYHTQKIPKKWMNSIYIYKGEKYFWFYV